MALAKETPRDVAKEASNVASLAAAREKRVHPAGSSRLKVGAGIVAVLALAASLFLVDSLAQCTRLGELQHALDQQDRAIEIGAYFDQPPKAAPGDLVVCDFTGLGVEDLYIAEHVHQHVYRDVRDQAEELPHAH